MENANISNKTALTPKFDDGVGIWYWFLRGIIGLAILAGNGPVIYLIATRHRLQTTSNWFILSLSVADLLVGVFVIPVSTSCSLLTNCNNAVMILFFDLLLFVSIGNMCAMTADRYLSVVKPLTYFQNMTNSRVFQWIVAAWMIPISFSVIPFAWITSKSAERKKRAEMIYGTIQIVSFNILPCVVMLLIYGHIFVLSRKHSRQIRALCVEQNAGRSRALNSRRMKQERSATRVFGLVLLIFVFCWLISAYRHFCSYFKLSCPMSSGTVLSSRLLMVANSAINPFIYALLKEDIKREVKRKLCRRRGEVEAFTSSLQSGNR